MNIAFLANSYHLQKTKSSDFFIDLLKTWFGTVSVIPHKDAWLRLPGTKWDLIISWQHLWPAAELEAFGADRIVLVPMYDDCPKDRASWEPYRDFRILSFSSTLGSDLQRWGHDVMIAQYWQPVPEDSPVDFSSLRGFFWPRTTGLTWRHIRTLISASNWSRFQLHVTNPEGAVDLPDEVERSRFRVEQTAWFESLEEAKSAVATANVYFAPRRYEGIGQAVLEALALGQCVVAPRAATMNEYIVDGVNGLLFDPDAPTPIDFSRAQEIGRQARQVAFEGRARWLERLPHMRDFLLAPPRARRRGFHPWIMTKGTATAWLRVLYRRMKKIAGRNA